jgi:hypothetical protein
MLFGDVEIYYVTVRRQAVTEGMVCARGFVVLLMSGLTLQS